MKNTPNSPIYIYGIFDGWVSIIRDTSFVYIDVLIVFNMIGVSPFIECLC